jgi:GT2 family glycosyltransferase
MLVDNGSSDGTAQAVAKVFPGIEVVRLENNVGIAKGYNAGIVHALEYGADYVIVLNNDTIVHQDMIINLMSAIKDNPDVGMVVPKIYYYDDHNKIWSAGARWYRFPPRIKIIGLDAIDGPEHQDNKVLEYATSCCLLMTREVIETVGMFDPDYYFYFDDWDLSERIRSHGYQILFVAEAHMWHKVSITTTKGENPGEYWFTLGKSSVRYYMQHKSLLLLMGFSLWFVIRETLKFKLNRIYPFLSGVSHGLIDYSKAEK